MSAWQDRLRDVLREMTLEDLVRHAGSGDDNAFANEIERRRDALSEAKEMATVAMLHWEQRLSAARDDFRRRS